ncbi:MULTISPECIES: hypothetical protein [unclassified Sedimentibacter]|uniref:hypothetical protein n=1 Tax=unclassified Sedimentibacter TaxID=2649220 RepID=UPI0027DEEEA3|nr:hypothetical protein [Sedimentibacter sp. MB35-C1]WMJ76419.1 hypothetical protein RBQ61_12385 [Sedimentibacter sp. MB35-C1]
MGYKIYAVLIILTFGFTFFEIFNISSRIKKRLIEEIIILNYNISNFIYAFIYIIILISWLVLLNNKIRNVNFLIAGNYIRNIFQLLDFEALRSAKEYFYENNMVAHFYQTVIFIKDFPNYLFWSSFSLCMSILFLYKGFQKNRIYESGIMHNCKIIKWPGIKNYIWSDPYKSKVLDKNEYCKLIIDLPTFFNLNTKVKLKIKCETKDAVDNILNIHTNIKS